MDWKTGWGGGLHSYFMSGSSLGVASKNTVSTFNYITVKKYSKYLQPHHSKGTDNSWCWGQILKIGIHLQRKNLRTWNRTRDHWMFDFEIRTWRRIVLIFCLPPDHSASGRKQDWLWLLEDWNKTSLISGWVRAPKQEGRNGFFSQKLKSGLE